MNVFRVIASELYIAARVRSLQLTAALVVLAAIISSVLVWSLPALMPQVAAADAATAAEMGVDLSEYSLDNPAFQLLAFDISGSFQSGLSMTVLVVLALGVLLPGMSFRHGAVTWKVLAIDSRVRWAAGTLAAVAILTGLAGLLAIAVVAATGFIAAPLQGGNVIVEVGELVGVWVRGLGVLILFALMAAAVVVAMKSMGRALAVIAVIAVAGITLSTVGTFAGWNGAYYSWLPLNAGSMAVGAVGAAPISMAAAWLILLAWTGLAIAWGLVRVSRYTL